MTTSGCVLAALCALGLSLALAPAAHATTYSVEGAFDEGHANLGVAVDQTTGDVYVNNFFESSGTEKFSSAGQLEAPTPFATGNELFGVAVDPLNENVYVYNAETQEIQTYPPAGVTPLGSFKVPSAGGVVEIASDSNGDVYFPDKEANTVLKFSPTGTLEATIEGQAPAGAFSAPQGVAVDASGNVYVADTGNKRTVRIEAGTGTQSVIDTGGTQDVAVDPVSGDVFALDLNEEGNCEPLPTTEPCYRVRAYHNGETTPFAEFGAGTINNAGAPNHIAVDHSTSKVYVSDFNHKVWIFAPGTPPKVAYPTPSATGVTATEATLHGEVNPQGNETSCHFEYGTTEAYGTSVPCQPELVGEGSKFKPEAVTISGLEGNTEYHFRLVATTAAGGLVHGADQTFTTSQAPPVVFASSVLASNVTQNDVFFNATLNPQHLDTHYYFNYGLHPFEDSASACVPPGTVPYATAPATPVDIGTAHSIPEEAAGLAVSPFDLAGATVLLHPGMGSRELQPNTVYHFQVVAENSKGAGCQPEATFITLPPDPLASTGAASAITQTAANLAGTVTPGSTGPNSDTTWRFQYGIDTGYTGGSVPATAGDAGVGTSAVPVSTALAGLAPNTTYHYRLVASNANHDPAANPAAAPQLADGADHTFTTPPAEPLLDQPSSLTETTLTLDGAVSPDGHDLHYSFQYGPTSGYGQSSPTEDAGEGANLTVVGVNLASLTPGVTYHYRLVVIGAGGENYSSDSTFTLYPPVPAQTGNPFSPGQSTTPPFPTMPLLSTPTFLPPPTETTPPPPKRVTNAQKFAKALKACKKLKKKSIRTKCEEEAKKKYRTNAKAKKTAKRGGRS
jgi:DNA-binding beta-propeller fold protein YncE